MTRFTSLLRLREFRRLLHLTLIALGLTSVGIACGTGASAPPIATVAPPAAAAQAPLVAPTATVTPATAVAPAEAPASVFQFPATRTPRPTPTPIPRAEGDMTAATLYNHRATLLEDGRVLVTGGHAATTPFAYILAGVKSSEIYDPATGRWSPTRPSFEGHRNHGAVLLEDGSVLVSGGLTGGFERGGHDLRVVWLGSIASAEVYDPSTETWSLVDDMPEETGHHSLEMAENGAVVVVGGLGESAALYPESTEGGRRVSVLRRQEGAPVLLG